MTERQRVYVNGAWRNRMPRIATDRDPYWLFAFDLARTVVKQAGDHCLACGSYLWSRAGTGRLYCDDTCKRRLARRRDRYRDFLRERDESCSLCGSHP